MTVNCPVCEEALLASLPQCETCGYPTALSADAVRALSEPEVPARAVERPARPASQSPRPPTTSAADSQAELCHRLAAELALNLALLHRLGGDAPALVSEMSQAALTQADGRVGEALGLLRNAHSRVILQGSELFERRLGELEKRQRTLTKDGVGVEVNRDLDAMRAEFEAGRRDEAIRLMTEVDQRLSRVENDWNGLRGLLRQIDSLRDAALRSGQDLPQVEEDLRQVREILSNPAVAAGGLDMAAQTAARALMLLHEALPPVLEQELGRHGEQLAGLPKDHERGRTARALHAEASRHLRRGRLVDASVRLKELRDVLQDVGASPSFASIPDPLRAPPAVEEDPEVPAVAVPVEDSSMDFLGRLLSKARGLAARVRTLPPDSEVAFEAAAEIRRATEQLRARKLDEAESTLTRLMRTLDAEHPAEA